MIALLTAVSEEARIVKDRIQNSVAEIHNGLSMTTGKLCGRDVCLASSGVGKAAAAAAATAMLYHYQPQALLLFGCGGAYPGSGMVIGDQAIASEEIFGDEGIMTIRGFQDLVEVGLVMRTDDDRHFNRWPIDATLHDWAMKILPGLHSGPFVTVSTCTGTTPMAHEIENRTGGICENMEGAAVALACHQMAVPMIELRGISNIVEDRDTTRWDLPRGMTSAQEAVLTLLGSWPESVA